MKLSYRNQEAAERTEHRAGDIEDEDDVISGQRDDEHGQHDDAAERYHLAAVDLAQLVGDLPRDHRDVVQDLRHYDRVEDEVVRRYRHVQHETVAE